MKCCNTCPTSAIGMYGFDNHPHPCHEDLSRPCVGHIQHLEKIKRGASPPQFIDHFRVDGNDQTEDHFLMRSLREVWIRDGHYVDPNHEPVTIGVKHEEAKH